MKNRKDLNLGEVVYIAKSDIIFNYCHYFILTQRSWEKLQEIKLDVKWFNTGSKGVTRQETSDVQDDPIKTPLISFWGSYLV